MATLFDPHFQAVDSAGAPISGAKLYFYQAGTTTAVTIYQDAAATTPHTNPVVADASGLFAPIYIVTVPYKFVLKTSSDVTIQTVDNVNNTTSQVVATRTALKALDTTAYTNTYLTESGRAGQFIWRTGDYSTEVAADTQEGVYIKADAIASTSGAWVRAYTGPLHAEWFGVVADDSTDNSTALQAAIDLAEATNKGIVALPPGNIRFGTGLVVDSKGVSLRGQGMDATILRPTTASMNAITFGDGVSVIERTGIYDLTFNPVASIATCIRVRNHHTFVVKSVTATVNYTTGIEIENGATAYLAFIEDFWSNAGSYGIRGGATGTGDLQNVILVNVHCDNATQAGVQFANAGGVIWLGGETLTCNRGLVLECTASGQRIKSFYADGVYFDTCTNENVRINVTHASARISGVQFANCSMNSAAAGSGVVIAGVTGDNSRLERVKLSHCEVIINKHHGIYLHQCRDVEIDSTNIVANGQATSNTYDGIFTDTSVEGLRVIGGLSGTESEYAASQRYGIQLSATTTEVRIDTVDLTGNVTGPVSDSTTAGQTIIENCIGLKTFARGAGTIPNGASSVSVNHGLGFTPAQSEVQITPTVDPGAAGVARIWVSGATSTQITVSSNVATVSDLFFGWSVGVKGC